MFCSNTQPPPAVESDMRRRACISWPCPIDTDFRARNRNTPFIVINTASLHRYKRLVNNNVLTAILLSSPTSQITLSRLFHTHKSLL
jgi:hypothetical protein